MLIAPHMKGNDLELWLCLLNLDLNQTHLEALVSNVDFPIPLGIS